MIPAINLLSELPSNPRNRGNPPFFKVKTSVPEAYSMSGNPPGDSTDWRPQGIPCYFVDSSR